MVSAIAQAANHSISLYNAIIVLHLCYLYVICEFMLNFAERLSRVETGEEGGNFLDLVVKDIFLELLVETFYSFPHWFWHGFGLYVWRHARRFGLQPECNAATKLIVFGKEFSAIGSGRHISLGE